MFAKKIKFEYIIITILGIALILIIAIVTYLNYLFGQRYKRSIRDEARQSAIENNRNRRNPYLFNTAPTSVPTESIIPKPLYNPIAEQILLNKINNRQPLSQRDLQVKSSILTTLSASQSSGILYRSANVTVRYNSSLDAFQGEITTTEFDLAKNEAVNWFKVKGFSQNAICNSPLYFYLSQNIQQQTTNTNFNLLPNDCLFE